MVNLLVILDPAGDLERGAKYVATVKEWAKDLKGNALAQPRRWTFTVAGGP